MAIIQISKIQHRTGANVDLPQLSEGELGFATDEQKLYIGNDPLLHPPANNNVSTQVEILTELSTLQHAKLEGSANTTLNFANTYPGQIMALGSDGNTWVNAGGNFLDPGNLITISNTGVHLGDADNVKLTGGINGYVLQTDGLGNLSWSSSGIIQYQIDNITTDSPPLVTTTGNNQITTGVPITISGVTGTLGTALSTAGENSTNKFYAKRENNTQFTLYKDTAFQTPVSISGTATYDANSLVTVSFYSQGTGSPGGANNQVQLNDGTGSFAGSANLTFSRITNNLNVSGNITGATNVVATNIRGAVTGSIGATTPNTGAFTSVTTTSTTQVGGNLNAQANINVVGIANVVGNLNAGNIRTAGLANVGNIRVVSNVTSNLNPNANVTYDLGTSTQAWKDVFIGNSITLNAVPIISDGDYVTVYGNFAAGNAYISESLTATTIVGTLYTNAQPNITSVGTLSSLSVRGPVDLGSVANLDIGDKTPNYVLTVKADGSGIDWLPTQLVRTVPGGSNTQLQFNDDGSFEGNANLTFSKTTGLLSTKSISAEGGNLSNITGANVTGTVARSTLATNVTANAQGNITSVGTLTSLTVTGNILGGNLSTGGQVVAVGNITGSNLITGGILNVTGNANVGNIGTNIGVFTGNISSPNVNVLSSVVTNVLTVNTNASIGNISTGNITSTGNISVGNLNASGNLAVTGNATLGNVTSVGSIVSTGRISTTDTLSVNGETTVGRLTSGNGSFNGNVSVTGNINSTGSVTAGSVDIAGNLSIAGNITGSLKPSQNIVYDIGTATQRYKDLYLSTGTIYLGGTVQIGADLTGAFRLNSNMVSTADISAVNMSASGNVNATSNVVAGNVYANAGTIGASLFTGTLTTNAQPNVTSLGRLSNLTVGNSTANSTFGNGSISTSSLSVSGNILLTTTTPIIISGSTGTAGQVLSTTGSGAQWITLTPNAIFNGTSNVSIGSSGSNVTVSVGGTTNVAVVSSTGVNIAGSLSATSLKLPGGTIGQRLVSDGAGGVIFANGKAFATSTVENLLAGSALVFDVDYANTIYPAGVFTLRQVGPASLAFSDTWSSGAASKNAYLNGLTSTVNTRDITITLSTANATLAINPVTDSILIGSTVITGASLSSIGIVNNSGGTYTIPSSLFSPTSQTTAGPISVTASLTTSRGQFTSQGISLTNNQYLPFNAVLSGSFPVSLIPYWNVNQTFNWSAAITGSVSSGNITYTQVGNAQVTGTLTSVGATSGSSPSLDSTIAYTITTTDLTGIGANVTAGTAILTKNATVTAATKYYPLFYKITSSSSNPNFTTSDTYLVKAFALGDGANTSSVATNYLWLAVPGTNTNHTFQHVDQGFTVVDTPDVTLQNQIISGYTYQVYGFTNFNISLKISVTT